MCACTRTHIGPKKKKSSRCILVFASGINVQTTFRFDKEFTEDLNDPSSSAFQELESSVNEGVSTIPTGYLLLQAQCSNVLAVTYFSPQLRSVYSEIAGFINAFVTGFRYGYFTVGKRLEEGVFARFPP